MKKTEEGRLFTFLIENETISKHFKTALVVISFASAIYLIGHFFKLSAHAVRGFKELKNAINHG